ncbi:MAG: acylphosphatase [Candidatus Thiodiazotropha sp. (ex Ctena orbiculata)]|nr:acylphosphatase [Candidatus Thiodiazotropha taylori]
MSDRISSGEICVRCFVGGRVQGVFYRASARHEAQRLGITGFAKNLNDGRVEVVACGRADALEELKDWLRKGPSGASVSAVSCEVIDQHNYADFTIG